MLKIEWTGLHFTLNTFNCRVQLQSNGITLGADLNCYALICLLPVLEGFWGS
jgi:hypothetical protein